MKRIRLIAIFILCSTIVYAQEAEDEKITGFYYGMQLGGYFANKADAAFYSGRPEYTNSVQDQIWGTTYMEQLQDELGFEINQESSFSFPYSIKYKPAVVAGLNGGYILNNGLTIIGNLNYIKLKAESYFNILVPIHDLDKADYSENIKGIISAQEQRVIFELGVHQPFIRPKKWHPFLEGGFCFVVTEVKKHEMIVESVTIPYSVREPNGNNTPIGGTSAGFFINAGLDFPITDRFNGCLGGGMAMYSIPLLDDPQMNQHYSIFFKIIFIN